MKISVLASGSSGNSTYIETKESSVLIDAGISARRIKKNLSKIGKDISELDGVFVTHEHTDHVYGTERLNRAFDVPIYINKKTYESLQFSVKPTLNEREIKLKDLAVKPIRVDHDAADPCGYIARNNGSSIAVFTDLGRGNQQVKNAINEVDCLVIESNHDVDMLLNGRYPYHLKERILSDKGHLSNIDTSLLIKENASDKLKTVVLAHLSENNNTEELARETFSQLVKRKYKSMIAKRKELSELIKV